MKATLERWTWGGLEQLDGDLRVFLARRCRDESELDDVVQETYIRAARRRHALLEPHKLRGWAMRIAANVLRDRQRRECRLPRADPGDHGLDGYEGPDPDPAEPSAGWGMQVDAAFVPRHVLLAELERAVGSLRQEDQRLLWSYYAGSLSSEETARDCGVPRPLVKVRLFRARRRLERCLRRGIASAEVACAPVGDGRP